MENVYNIIMLSLLKISLYFVEVKLFGMTIIIQVSKTWVSLTHIISERASESRREYSFSQYFHII